LFSSVALPANLLLTTLGLQTLLYLGAIFKPWLTQFA